MTPLRFLVKINLSHCFLFPTDFPVFLKFLPRVSQVFLSVSLKLPLVFYSYFSGFRQFSRYFQGFPSVFPKFLKMKGTRKELSTRIEKNWGSRTWEVTGIIGSIWENLKSYLEESIGMCFKKPASNYGEKISEVPFKILLNGFTSFFIPIQCFLYLSSSFLNQRFSHIKYFFPCEFRPSYNLAICESVSTFNRPTTK